MVSPPNIHILFSPSPWLQFWHVRPAEQTLITTKVSTIVGGCRDCPTSPTSTCGEKQLVTLLSMSDLVFKWACVCALLVLSVCTSITVYAKHLKQCVGACVLWVMIVILRTAESLVSGRAPFIIQFKHSVQHEALHEHYVVSTSKQPQQSVQIYPKVSMQIYLNVLATLYC